MIEQFSKEDFETYLSSAHSPFTPLGLIDGEYTYALPLDNQVSITVRSSVKSNGLSADVGKDSIRCWLVSNDKPLGSKVSKWTTRQPGWQDRLSENIKQLALWRALAGDCRECERPKGIFKAHTEANKGRPFARCREHNGFVWLDKPIETSNIYFSEASYENSKTSVQGQVAHSNKPISTENVMQSDDSSGIHGPDRVDSEKYNDLVCLQKLPEKTNLQVRDDIYFSEDSYDNSEKVDQQDRREVACAKKSAKGSDIGTTPANDVWDKNNGEGHLGNRELGSRQSMLQELPKGPDQTQQSAIEAGLNTEPDDIILESYIEEESYDGSNIGQMDMGAYSAKPQETNNVQNESAEYTLQNLNHKDKIENLPQMLSSKKTAPNTQQRQAISEESYDINERDTEEAEISYFSGQEKHGDSVRQNSDVSRENSAANTKEVSEGSHDLSELLELLEKTPNSQQKQAIEADINASLRVLAGPGSGKTFVIEHRYKFLVENGIDPDKIIVCTFGKQSATDMGQRIQKTCPQANLEQICTINALCHRLLTKWYPDSRWHKWRGPKDWQVKKLLEDAIGPIWQESEKPGAQEIYNLINTSKYLSLTTDDSYLWFTEVLGQRRGAWLYEIRSKFDAWLNRNRFLTFADQLFLVEQQLKNDANWRSMVQGKFSHVVIDESQDTNYQAMRILITISLEPGQNAVYESEEK